MSATYEFDITSANATAALTVEGICSIQLQQFSADQSIGNETRQYAETRMGVDGYMAAGQVPGIYVVTVSLEACSPSAKWLRMVALKMDQERKLFRCTLTFKVPSIGWTYTYSQGVLQQGTPIPSGKKILDPTQWTFHFAQLQAVQDTTTGTVSSTSTVTSAVNNGVTSIAQSAVNTAITAAGTAVNNAITNLFS